MLHCCPDGIIGGGRYDGLHISYIAETDPEYAWWLKTKANISGDIDNWIGQMSEPEVRLWFGKHKGRKLSIVKEIDPKYITFMKTKMEIKNDRLKKALQNM